ncbi:ankyrin repeat domain-containing protein 33B [Ornithorhynchus anatinus]|uniref:ankyrin repeat domain-containing protein 33B n=1 Tax=Ornithorhynchus anatinus TaxID=9258 RepID=UPI0010A92516|nr:ankyrin repeat domain-containing protein 33B [Ornithorhynchus anatinus]
MLPLGLLLPGGVRPLPGRGCAPEDEEPPQQRDEAEREGRLDHAGAPGDEDEDGEAPRPLTLLGAASTNNALLLRALIRRGPAQAEVRDTDRNNRTALIVACYQGFVDIVIALAQCPHIDVNWQDNEGNTALITAAQAGHITITNYLLNYFPGLDLEKRNAFGYTALMKAAMQGRTECIRALMLAGANIHATDPNRKMNAWEWACFTGRYEAASLIRRLLDRPCPEQLSERYKPEWPGTKETTAKAVEPKSCLQRLSDCVRATLFSRYPREPADEGALDHMVRMTTGLGSPFVATSCQTVCPESPPCVGKRRLAVQEILRWQRAQELQSEERDPVNSYEKVFPNSRVVVVPKKKDRRASLQVLPSAASQAGPAATRKTSLLPLHLLRRSSVRPGFVIPKVRVNKAPPATFQPEHDRRKSSSGPQNGTYLQIPRWKYKEVREERRKAEEEEEKKKADQAQKGKRASLRRKT